MKKITVAHGHTSIEVLHSLVPFVLSSNERDDWSWSFKDYRLKNIFNESGDLLILVRKYHDGKSSNEKIISELIQLRKKFNKIIYFDDSAAASVVFFCTFPYVDQYWKRSVLKDYELYKNKLYGGHIFSNYYHKKFDIDDEKQIFFNPPLDQNVDLNKLKIAWNIGVGIYPLNKNNVLDRYYSQVRRLITGMIILPNIKPIYFLTSYYLERLKKELTREISFKKKISKISSRFLFENYRKSIGYQRKLMLEKIKYKDYFLLGYKDKSLFTKEIFNVFGTLSPFGWGEICYRDFESVIGGSYLIKPNMKHLSTWPNIYENSMYHSLSWDFSELDKLNFLFEEKEKCELAVNKSREKYLNSLNTITSRCIKLISEVI